MPTEDEWYKAAYYKGGGTNAGYWDYPTSSDSAPTAEPPPGGRNSANWDNTVGGPEYTSPCGAYSSSQSAYGALDMAGNLTEWTEELYLGTDRLLRGGAFDSDTELSLIAGNRGMNLLPTDESLRLGFRIALIPEPTTALLALAGGLVILKRRQRA